MLTILRLSYLKISIAIALVIIISIIFLLPTTASAEIVGGTDCGERTFLGIPAWDKYLIHEEINGRCSAVINGEDINNARSVLAIGLAILEAAIRLGGLVAVAMVIWGAFKYITTQGNPENAAAARKTIINSLVGLVIVIISTSVVSFFGNTLTN